MKASDVRQGGFYVNDEKGLVREVWLLSQTGYAHWRSFHLESGEPANDSFACFPERIAKWANRIATSEEAARMKTELADASDRASTEDLVALVIGDGRSIKLS